MLKPTLSMRQQLAARVSGALTPGKLFIDNEWLDGDVHLEVKNPATGVSLNSVVLGSEEDVERAVAAARKALSGPWARLSARERGKLIRKLAEGVESKLAELACLESLHNGKTVTEAERGELPACVETLDYYAGWADKLHGETIPVSGPYLNYTLREPVGVVGAIVPWNYPLLLAMWKIGPALASGCTLVLKPDEKTPLTALALGDLVREAGFPPGVLNIVTGDGETTGAALARSKGVDKVAFTGSTETGRKILHAAADSNLKRVSLELGGKSPNIVFADADMDAALQGALWGIFANKGEVCSAGSRLLVERSAHDAFVARLVEKSRGLKVGDPLDPGTRVGSIASEGQLERVLGYVEAGKESGATLACGGERLTEGALAQGFFMPPTVFTDVDADARIAQEEIFGPVLVVLPFDDEDDCARLANHTCYGLASAVWTRDVGRAHSLARRIEAGSVWINDYGCFDTASPFGGVKHSGFGREMGEHALQSYTRVKSVWVKLGR